MHLQCLLWSTELILILCCLLESPSSSGSLAGNCYLEDTAVNAYMYFLQCVYQMPKCEINILGILTIILLLPSSKANVMSVFFLSWMRTLFLSFFFSLLFLPVQIRSLFVY